MQPRSLLFVPGSRPDRFDKARAAGADLTCIDLEDSVAPVDRQRARLAIGDYLALLDAGARTRVGVRVNATASRDGLRDLAALADGIDAGFVMLAKAEDAAVVATIASAFGHTVPLWPVLETPRGIRHAAGIARMPGVAGVMFGGADLAAALGVAMDWEPLLHARQAIVAAAAEAGVAALDVPEIVLEDDARLAAGCRRARAIGFAGRACIHPQQIEVIHRAFAPDEDDIARARRIVAAFESGDGGAARLDGVLLERPLVAAARTLDSVDRQ